MPIRTLPQLTVRGLILVPVRVRVSPGKKSTTFSLLFNANQNLFGKLMYMLSSSLEVCSKAFPHVSRL